MPTVARTARLEARVTPEVMELLKRAADLEGRSVTDFVVAAARAAATHTIERTEVIRLSIADQEAFVRLLLDPPASNEAVLRAKANHKRLIEPS